MQTKSRVFNPGMLKHIVGDATIPHGGGHRMLMHICNDKGGWGRGFVVALSKRYKQPEQQYRLWSRAGVLDHTKFELGQVQFVDVQTDLCVANMVAQHDTVSKADEAGNMVPPIRYDALKKCLERVAKEALDRKSTVACPRIGSGLAGGDWDQIESLLVDTLINKGINVTIYTLPEEQEKFKK